MPEARETKACPYCGEEILAVAVKCKHCGSDLSQLLASEAAAGLQVDLSNRAREYIAQNRPASPGAWLSGKLYCTPDISFFVEVLALIICPLGLFLFAISLVLFIRSGRRTAPRT